MSRVVATGVELTTAGDAVERAWLESTIRWDLRLDSHIVMPDHFHGILHLLPTAKTGRTLGTVVAGVKSAAARAINRLRATPGAVVFQRGYHEHVVRDEEDLLRIRTYIAANPARWLEKAICCRPTDV